MKLIDADALKRAIRAEFWKKEPKVQLALDFIDIIIGEQPVVDAVSRGLHDLVRWERDVAIKQLEEHGIPFGGKAPDVVKVCRCKDCEHRYYNEDLESYCCEAWGDGYDTFVRDVDFCSHGERKDGDG